MNLYKTILRTPLFKATSLNSISVLLKIGTGLITSKILAIFIGPAGMALTGNLKNFMTSVESVATLGFQNGVVKYIVESKNDAEAFKKIMSSVFLSLLAVSLVMSFGLYAFADYWTNAVLGSGSSYAHVFKILAVLLPWYATSAFLLVVLNGLGKYRSVIYTNIIGNILGLLFALGAVYYYRTFGALLSIIVPPTLLFFVVIYYINKDFRFLSTISHRSFDRKVLKNMSSYSLMALVTAILGSWVFIGIRKNIIAELGIEQAGYWEAMTRISNYYLLFISTMLSVYFFPKLSFATSKTATRNVIKSYYNGLLPLFLLGLTVLYFLRYFVVKLIFTKEFLPVSDLFFWQLLGDMFKASALILGYQFFARKLTMAYIVTEIFSLGMMYTFCHFFLTAFGIEGIVMAHALTYFIYWMVLVVYFRKSLF